ncbi:MAG: phosphotransferase [Pseudomonadota bacterium]
MSSRTTDHDLLQWALGALEAPKDVMSPSLDSVAGDASPRRYYRAIIQGRPYILVDAPPTTENNRAFVDVRQLLEEAGLKVPTLFAADLGRGHLVLEDLGDRLLLDELDATTVDAAYSQAFAALLRLACIDTATASLPAYDQALLMQELQRFPEWFVQSLLGLNLSEDEHSLLMSVFQTLVASALEQPQVVVHRDFHSRNLMPQPGGELAVIDFQDAVVGPVTYDLVSLLRDCYIRWPEGKVEAWVLGYYDTMASAGLGVGDADQARFLKWFDLMGLQRHIKVLGTFARLYLRDGKAGYLQDLPLVVSYIMDVLDIHAEREPTLASFRQWFDARLMPVIAAQPWANNR